MLRATRRVPRRGLADSDLKLRRNRLRSDDYLNAAIARSGRRRVWSVLVRHRVIVRPFLRVDDAGCDTGRDEYRPSGVGSSAGQLQIRRPCPAAVCRSGNDDVLRGGQRCVGESDELIASGGVDRRRVGVKQNVSRHDVCCGPCVGSGWNNGDAFPPWCLQTAPRRLCRCRCSAGVESARRSRVARQVRLATAIARRHGRSLRARFIGGVFSSRAVGVR